MVKTIILFALAIVVAILLGFNMGKKRGYIRGWNAGNKMANEFWEKNLPKEVYYKVMMPKVQKLFESLFNDEEE